LSTDRQKILPDRWLTPTAVIFPQPAQQPPHLDPTLGTASASPVAILGAIVSATLLWSPIGGIVLIMHMVSPVVPVFGFLYPMEMVIVGHDGGCGGGGCTYEVARVPRLSGWNTPVCARQADICRLSWTHAAPAKP